MPLIVVPKAYTEEQALEVAKKFQSVSVDELVNLLSQSIPNLDAALKTEKALRKIKEKLKFK